MNIQRLKEIREDKDLKQSDVAKVLGIKQQQYSEYEIGKRLIPINYLSAQSIFSHGLMAFLGYELIASRMYVPNLKRDCLPIYGIFLIFCLVIKIMCYVYGQNFFGMVEFLLFGWDLPFVAYFLGIYLPLAALACVLLLWVGEKLTKRGRQV